MTQKAPPDQWVLDAAIEAARSSPCAKSQRGVVVFTWRLGSEGRFAEVIGRGFNHKPYAWAANVPAGVPELVYKCDGSLACRAHCSKLNIHAEQAAILEAALENESGGPLGAELLHVKVVDGALVAGGGPSCWECSKAILEFGIKWVWLYQTAESRYRGRMDVRADGERLPSGDAWVQWSAEEFHIETMRACGLDRHEVGPT